MLMWAKLLTWTDGKALPDEMSVLVNIHTRLSGRNTQYDRIWGERHKSRAALDMLGLPNSEASSARLPSLGFAGDASPPAPGRPRASVLSLRQTSVCDVSRVRTRVTIEDRRRRRSARWAPSWRVVGGGMALGVWVGGSVSARAGMWSLSRGRGWGRQRWGNCGDWGWWNMKPRRYEGARQVSKSGIHQAGEAEGGNLGCLRASALRP